VKAISLGCLDIIFEGSGCKKHGGCTTLEGDNGGRHWRYEILFLLFVALGCVLVCKIAKVFIFFPFEVYDC